ncbi:MAG: glycosyltransferase [Actinomycetota bacterium]
MTSPLRIGLDVTPLVGPPTGIHQHTRHLASALAERDDVELSGWLLSARGARPEFPGPTRRSPVPAAVAARTWRVSSWPGRRSLAGDVDVVHGTNFLGPPEPTTVLTVQDLTPLREPERVDPAVAAKGPAIRRAIDRGAWVHVSSALVGAELEAETGSDRIRVVHHALPEPFPITPGAGRRIVGRDRYVVVVGTTAQRKRVDRVVAAVAELDPSLSLVVVGPAGDAERALDAAIARHRMDERVVRLTDLDDGRRSAVVADAAALALASDYEGFGLTPLEALRAGVPVAATAVGVLPELIGHDIGLADPMGEDFTAHLEQAIDASVPAALIERLQALTWAEHAEQMMDLYASAATS